MTEPNDTRPEPTDDDTPHVPEPHDPNQLATDEDNDTSEET